MKVIEKMLMLMLFANSASSELKAQDSIVFNTGADLYSNYIWRGSKFGTGPAFQPSVKMSFKNLTIGVWGSFDASGYTESDPYILYSFPFGVSVGVTDYYYPGLEGSLFSDTSNAVEANLGYTIGGLSISANYIFNEAPVPASLGSDMYFQIGYAFSSFNISAGAGDGWHTAGGTADGKFNLCHIALGTSKEIRITESFSIPVIGQVILNPDKKNMYVVFGISF